MTTEYVQFVGALIFLLGILIASYWFVYVPNRDGRRRRDGGRGEGR